MKNSIEEDMKILEGIIKGDEDCINTIYSQMKVKNDNDEDIQYYKKEIQSIKNIVDNYLKEKARADKLEKEYSAMLTESDENECDYKRVLKENEELKEDRKNNNVMISLAQNELLNYMSGYEDGKKHKMTAMAQVIENQQYYIVRKQMEKYEEHIKRLQKENEELKNQEATQRKINELLVQRYSNSIPVQKVKDKISERQFELQQEYKDFEDDAILIVLQELLEGRK
jgi:hypothetical protein